MTDSVPAAAMPKRVVVIGGGPAGLMAADVLSDAGLAVTIYERMPTVGRKLLMAGRGGLNLTHTEPLVSFLARYAEAAEALRPAIQAFPPAALRDWADGLGQQTFVGSSGRVFPRAMKASPLLRAWLARLADHGVRIVTRSDWLGWNGAGALVFRGTSGLIETVAADAVVLALGGASWPRLGADGSWMDILRAQGIAVAPLRPANCGFKIAWSAVFRERFAGQPLKNIVVSNAGRTVAGEAMITAEGLEGGAIYALSSALREQIATAGSALLMLDLRPEIARDTLIARLSEPRRGQTATTWLRKATGLSPVGINLLRETTGNRLPDDPVAMAELIKRVPLRLIATAGIERAISSAGGVSFAELNQDYMLRRLSGVFVAGEMLDWEAPTGGYLLQAVFATGAAAGRGALRWLTVG